MTDVVFPVMPFADPGRPAIGASLLSSAAGRLGRSSRVFYFTFGFAERVGLDTYRRIGNGFPPDSLVGEWVFADLLFGEEIPDADNYVGDILGAYGLAPEQVRDVVAARSHADAFVTDCVERILECEPRVVGFTTTFHQTCACLAVARRLKARCPIAVDRLRRSQLRRRDGSAAPARRSPASTTSARGEADAASRTFSSRS